MKIYSLFNIDKQERRRETNIYFSSESSSITDIKFSAIAASDPSSSLQNSQIRQNRLEKNRNRYFSLNLVNVINHQSLFPGLTGFETLKPRQQIIY